MTATLPKPAFLILLLTGLFVMAGEKVGLAQDAHVTKFSERPQDAEFFSKQLLPVPLIPTSGKGTEAENAALSTALNKFTGRAGSEDSSSLSGFIELFPQSRWNVALLANLGSIYYSQGYFTKALESWKKAWVLGKDETEPKAKQLVDYAIAEYAKMNARVGRKEVIGPLLAELAQRPMMGNPAETLSGVRDAYYSMEHHPGESFRCGPLALYSILNDQKSPMGANPLLLSAPSTEHGFSLVEVRDLAAKMGTTFQIVKRQKGAPLIVPSIVHWRLNHYAAILSKTESQYHIKDPTFGHDLSVSQAALDEEASGYYLIPGKMIPAGYTSVPNALAKTIWGRGLTSGKDPDRTKSCESSESGDGGGGGGGWTGQDGDGGCSTCNSTAMARYSVKLMLMSLAFNDTPLWYTPSIGPSVSFALTYNQREANQPAIFNHSNLGNRWTFGWISYIIDNPDRQGNGVKLYLRGGGAESYGNGDGLGNFPPQQESQATLKYTITGSSPAYVRTLPNGAQEIYDLPNGSTMGSRYIYLTKIIDPQGRTLRIGYDAQFRVIRITDALGQVTTLSYALTSDPLKITTVTDPFGRSASFTYDTVGHLVTITDMIGITSQFTYAAGSEDITALTTPYGTTTFTLGKDPNNNRRWIDIVNPLGQKERMESVDTSPIPHSDQMVPTGMGITNEYLQYRNTFYWDRKTTIAYGTTDYTKAKLRHFLHTPSLQTSGILESIKNPFENRVWYDYQGQGASDIEGPTGLRTHVGRVLDDGTTQLTTMDYNDQGAKTLMIDPAGRETDYVYDANGIDLLQIKQKTSTGTELLSKTTYNGNHQPLTVTDASGQTTTYTYTVDLDVQSVTTPPTTASPAGETTTTTYDPAHPHQPKTVTGPIAGAVTSYAYDNLNRLRSVTDSEGYTLTYDYDALDRMVKTTYPDGTTEEKTYNRLDVATTKDRMGRVTTYTYDGIRQKVGVKDALGRLTLFEWCYCGALQGLTDPLGQKTAWAYDIEGRMLSKTFADGSKVQYTYENTTRRLKSMTDALGQVTSYTYNVDNTMSAIQYSGGVHPAANVGFSYDPYYNRLNQMTDGTGTTVYAYGPVGSLGANQLSSVDGPLANDTITYSYDSLGRVVGTSVNGVGQTSTYDKLGRVTQTVNPLGTFGYQYLNATARPTIVSYPNRQKTTYTYYSNSQDQRLQQIQNIASNGRALSTFGYQYNAVGNITEWNQVQVSTSTFDTTYTYDLVDRLVRGQISSADSVKPITSNYVYDRADNRLTEQLDQVVKGASYNNLNQLVSRQAGGVIPIQGSINKASSVTVNGDPAEVKLTPPPPRFTAYLPVTPGLNKFTIVAKDGSGNSSTQNYQVTVSGSGSNAYQYDANGNLLSDGTRTYEWDSVNRLTAINVGSARTEMSYDGIGRRVLMVEKYGGTVTTTRRFIWNGNQMAEERDANNQVVKRFYAQGEQIGGTAYYFTRDHLGSVRELMDAKGGLRAVYQYDSYGRVSKVGGDVESDFQYAGMFEHSSSGLNLTYYRAYDPDTARWLSRDPLENAEMRQGTNLYWYAANNSIRLMDPMGMAYFASGGLSALGGTWLGILSQNPIDAYFDTEVSHEQLFFEDGKQPSNIGYGPNGKFSNEDPSKYHKRDGGYDDCVMRKAADAVNWPGKDYCLIGHNCQSWADAVRKKYSELKDDPTVKQQCCKEKSK